MGPHPGYRNLFQGQECKLPVNNCMMLDAARAALVHELRKNTEFAGGLRWQCGRTSRLQERRLRRIPADATREYLGYGPGTSDDLLRLAQFGCASGRRNRLSRRIWNWQHSYARTGGTSWNQAGGSGCLDSACLWHGVTALGDPAADQSPGNHELRPGKRGWRAGRSIAAHRG